MYDSDDDGLLMRSELNTSARNLLPIITQLLADFDDLDINQNGALNLAEAQPDRATGGQFALLGPTPLYELTRDILADAPIADDVTRILNLAIAMYDPSASPTYGGPYVYFEELDTNGDGELSATESLRARTPRICRTLDS